MKFRCKKRLVFVTLLLLALAISLPVAAGEQALAPETKVKLQTMFRRAWDTGAETIDVSGLGLAAQQAPALTEYYLDCVYDAPEYFYVETGCTWTTQGDRIVHLKPDYIPELMAPQAKTAFEQAVQQALQACVHPDMEPAGIALALHDYLVLNCAYNWQIANGLPSTDDAIYTAYGALVNGDPVCQGYGLAYNTLLRRCGIEAKYVSSQVMDHGWSIIKLDDAWYHVDVTWDDPTDVMRQFDGQQLVQTSQTVGDMPSYVQHDFFLLSDTAIRATHNEDGQADHRVHDADGAQISASSSKYQAGWVFNGATTPFFAYDGALYYLTQTGMIAVTENLKSGSEPADQTQNVVRWPVSFRDGSIYYGMVEGHYVNKTQMDVYRYDIDLARTQSLGTVTNISVIRIGLQWQGDTLQLVQHNGTAVPTVVGELPNAAAYTLPGIAFVRVEWAADGFSVWIGNGGPATQARLYIAAYQDGRMIDLVEKTDIVLPAGEKTVLRIPAAFSSETDLVQIFLSDAVSLVPLTAQAVGHKAS